MEASNSGVEYLLNVNGHKRLFLFLVKRSGPIGNPCEIYLGQVDAADGAVVHRTIIDDPVCDVGGGSPLCGAGNVGRNLAVGKLYADGNIEIIQDLEPLADGIFCRVLYRSRSLIEGGTDESRRRSDIAGDAQKTAACSERGNLHIDTD